MPIAAPLEVEPDEATVEVDRRQSQDTGMLAAQKQSPALNEARLNKPKDHFVQRDDLEFAGTHLLLDLWDAKHLDNMQQIEQAMRDMVDACGATLLHIHLHRFSPSGGISGVAVLAESHISVHTWPERDYAAFDVFMCGDAQPENAVPVLKQALQPRSLKVFEQMRGQVDTDRDIELKS